MQSIRTWSISISMAAALTAAVPVVTASAGSVAPCGICSGDLAEADAAIAGMGWSAYQDGDDVVAPDPSWAYGMGWSASGGDGGFEDDRDWLFGLISSALEGDTGAVEDDSGYAYGMSSSALEGFVELVAVEDLDEAHLAIIDARALGNRHVALFSAPVEMLGTRMVTWIDPGSLPTELQRELDGAEQREPVLALLDPTVGLDHARTRMSPASVTRGITAPGHVTATVYEPPNIHPTDPHLMILDPALLGVDADLGRGGLSAPAGLAAPVHVVLTAGP